MENDQEDRLSRVERMTLRMSVVQTAIGVTGFFVALIALYAALNEADAVRKQQQASVWPHLEFHRSYRGVPDNERLEIVVRNSGIGPAKVEMVEFFTDGEPLSSWDELLDSFTQAEDRWFSHAEIAGVVIRPEHEYSIFSVTAQDMDSDTIVELREAIDAERVNGRLCYCSVFDECWILQSHSRNPQPVDQCPTPERENNF